MLLLYTYCSHISNTCREHISLHHWKTSVVFCLPFEEGKGACLQSKSSLCQASLVSATNNSLFGSQLVIYFPHHHLRIHTASEVNEHLDRRILVLNFCSISHTNAIRKHAGKQETKSVKILKGKKNRKHFNPSNSLRH